MRALNEAPPPIDDTYLNEMRAMGLPENIIRQEVEKTDSHDIEVLEENWQGVLWFCQTLDCYRYSDTGICLGMDFPQVQSEKQLSGRQASTEDFAVLKDMAREQTLLSNAAFDKQTQPSAPELTAPPD